jgi:UDP-N-acetylmuramoylalanine--D-glutamate ligase
VFGKKNCKKIVLIVGGYDKNLSFENLVEAICLYVKVLIVMGMTAEKIKNFVLNSKYCEKPTIFEVKNMREAVKVSNEKSGTGDVVILSPAASSFDLYKNFEERGNDFKKIVNML